METIPADRGGVRISKERADILLVKQGLSQSRERAKALIMAGVVYDGVTRIQKAGEMLSGDKRLRVKENPIPFVGRGGLKLAKALDSFGICLDGKVVLDIGASTGGFTDCALQRGASRVYAVDVGYGQLDWGLRQDPRVVAMDRTNARFLTADSLGGQVDFVTLDVSFISLDKLFPVLPGLMHEQGEGVALVKPQFEAGRGQVGKKGVVKDPDIHKQVVGKTMRDAEGAGFVAYALTWSPIKGQQGNIEYLLWFGLDPAGGLDTGVCNVGRFAGSDGLRVVEAAFEALNGS